MATQYLSDPAELEDIERAGVDELRSLQLTRLRWSLGNAYRNCAIYRRKCEAAGVRPEDLRSLGDLTRFPFTTRQDLCAAYPFGMFAVPRERVVRIQESAGTTGTPALVAGCSAHDVQTSTHLVARSIRAAGGRAGDVVHIALDYGLQSFALAAHQAAEQMGCMVVPASLAPLAKQVQAIQDFEPDIIITTPSYLLAITEELARQGLEPSVTSLRIALLGGEPWTEAMRQVIRARTGVEPFDIYGVAELMGIGVACESQESRDGAVLWEDHFYPEIIDPRSEAPLEQGVDGELVITTLTREALPLIRYRTRDLTRLLPPTARPMRRIARIAGRLDDELVLGAARLLPGQIETLVLKEAALAPIYQLVLSGDAGAERLAVHVEAASALASEQRPAVVAALLGAIRDATGLDADVSLGDPGSLPRSQGRAVRVRDLRPPPSA